MSTSKVWVWAIAVGAACALGCGDDDGGDGDSGGGSGQPPECQPANTFSCVGSNGCRGVQICNRDGTWGACNCGGSSGGQGGGAPSGQAGSSGGSADGGVGTLDAGPGAGGDGAGGSAGDGAGGSAGDGAGGSAGDGSGGSDAPDEDEDCDNGEDDDGDDDVDCADEDCDERVCARTAPDGWDGPAVLFLDDLPDDCPNAYGDELVRGGLAATGDDAECDTCTCTPSSPGCADFLSFRFSTDDECGTDIPCSTATSSSCVAPQLDCLDGLSSVYLELQLPNGLDTCEANTQSPSISDAEWTSEALACGANELERGGCNVGSVCAPPLPDGASLCILRAGDRDCPDSGPYTERTVVYTDIDDDRDCSDCACDQDCDYTWNTYLIGDTTCSTPLLSLDTENQCVPVNPEDDGTIRIGAVIDGTGDCEPSGGEPEGGVTEEGPITVCCED